MSRILSFALLYGLLAGGLEASVLVLKDGRALRTLGEPRESGSVVVFQLEDGVWVSVRKETVDWPASERARRLLDAGAGLAPARPERSDPRGPRELDSLSEGRLLDALVHTGRNRRLPGPAEDTERSGRGAPASAARRAAGGLPAIGPPRPGAWEPLFEPGPSPYVGALEEASDGPALARVAPLVGPAGSRGPLPAPATSRPLAFGPPRPEELERVLASITPTPREGFLSPRDGDAVLGAVTLEARPRPGGAALAEIEYRVDGAVVGRASAEPWQATWQAPGDRAPHHLEAHMRRADGSTETARARVLDVLPDAEVDVELVPLAVAVTNHDYMFVRDLGADDFLIYEDGVRQEIAHFSREPSPLRVLVAVDSSWSMNGRKLEMAAEALRRLSHALGPDDRIAAATFGETFRLLVPFGADRAAAAAALDDIEADGGTAMLDAERSALELLGREEGRRVLILVGDGEDYLSRTRLDDLVVEAQRLQVSVYAVGILLWRLKDGLPEHWADGFLGKGRPAYWSDSLRVRGLKILRRQTDATGGVLYMPKFAGELPYVFEHLLAELKSSYQIGYYPANRKRDGRFRSIEVEVDGKGLVARTRKGYYAPGVARASR